MSEQKALRSSIVVTLLIAAFGVILGILSGSAAVIFDGIYSSVDAGMTILALLVSTLIAKSTKPEALSKSLRSRFSMGFWHLEPIVLGLNATLLFLIAAYGLLNAITAILSGGRDLSYDLGILYAAVSLVVCAAMVLRNTLINRKLQSDFVALDTKSWTMAAAITGALLVSFAVALLLERSDYAWLVPYVDPAILSVISLVMLPLPIPEIRQALSEIFLMTPLELKAHVDEVAEEIVAQEGFLDYLTFVAKTGRGLHMEVYFILPPDLPPRSINDWDDLRNVIGKKIGYESPHRWLTIVFTADRGWAE